MTFCFFFLKKLIFVKRFFCFLIFMGFVGVFLHEFHEFFLKLFLIKQHFLKIWTSIDNINYTDSVLKQMECVEPRWSRLVYKTMYDKLFFGGFMVVFAVFVGFFKRFCCFCRFLDKLLSFLCFWGFIVFFCIQDIAFLVFLWFFTK